MRNNPARRVDRHSSLIRRISALSKSGTRADADKLASEAQSVLGENSSLISAAERHFLNSFLSAPYKRLPKGVAEESPGISEVSVRNATDPGSVDRSGVSRPSPPRTARKSPRSQALHKIAERNRGRTLGQQLASEKLSAAEQLQELVQEVKRVTDSQDRDQRRAVLRKVSLFLYHVPEVQPDTPGIKILRAFRDRPFRGLQSSPSTRDGLEPRDVPRKTSLPERRPRYRKDSPAQDVADRRPVPKPSDIASRVSPSNSSPGQRPFVSSEVDRDDRSVGKGQDKTYRTFLSFDREQMERVLQVLNDWLEEKKLPVVLGESLKHTSDDRFAESLALVSGESTYYRLRMAEKQPKQNFHTDVILGAEPGESWLWVNVSSDGPMSAQAPRFVGKLLLKDGPLNTSGTSELTFGIVETDTDSERLYEYLVDPLRSIPVFIAGTDDVPGSHKLQDDFRESAKVWSRETLGLARFVVLGAEATDYLEEKLGEGFAPRRWSVRTYEPELDLNDPNDIRRHRFFSTERLHQMPAKAVASRLGKVARAISERRGSPPQVRTALYAFTQEENVRLLRGLTGGDDRTRERVARTEAAYATTQEFNLSTDELRQVGVLKELLEIPTFSEDLVLEIAQRFTETSLEVVKQVEDRLQQQAIMVEVLESERDSARMELELSGQQVAGVESEAQHLRKQVRWLQNELQNRGHAEAAYSDLYLELSQEDPPANFEELLDGISDFENQGVVFTGSDSVTLELDDVDTQGRAVHAAWMSLLTLADYLRSKENGVFQGDVHSYLSSPPGTEYTTIPPGNHASWESDTTMSQYGDQRIFDVPHSVSEDGQAVMEAHFKLHRIGMISPRLHYLDRSSAEGKMYVGYIGPHLKTPSTN